MLEKSIIEKFKKINHINNLNHGGCLFAALGVFLSLKNEGKDLKNISVVQLSRYCDKDDIENNKSFLSGNSQEAVSSSHFGLSVDGGQRIFDSRGLLDKEIFEYYLLIPSEQIINFSNSALKHGSWNHRFDRSLGIPLLNDALKIDLKLEDYAK